MHEVDALTSECASICPQTGMPASKAIPQHSWTKSIKCTLLIRPSLYVEKRCAEKSGAVQGFQVVGECRIEHLTKVTLGVMTEDFGARSSPENADRHKPSLFLQTFVHSHQS